MKVARIIFTILNFIPNILIIPRIHIQLTNIGKKEIMASSIRPKDSHRNTKTINEQAKPI